MKKNIILLGAVLVVFTLAIFGFNNRKESAEDTAEVVTNSTVSIDELKEKNNNVALVPDFFYDLGTQFNGITKAELSQLTSFNDLIGDEHIQRIIKYSLLSVTLLEGNEQTDVKFSGLTGSFTLEQLNLLKSLDYSDNVMVRANYTEKWPEAEKAEESYWSPYLTVVPKKQAEYIPGKEAFIQYLKTNNRMNTVYVQRSQLKSGKLFFTVTKDGIIENAEVINTSGYTEIDEKMMELINNTQGKWTPAETIDGEKVDQELVISFGGRGC